MFLLYLPWPNPDFFLMRHMSPYACLECFASCAATKPMSCLVCRLTRARLEAFQLAFRTLLFDHHGSLSLGFMSASVMNVNIFYRSSIGKFIKFRGVGMFVLVFGAIIVELAIGCGTGRLP